MVTDRTKLEEALGTGEFAAIVGTVENSWFDAKEQPYELRTDTGKRAFAKDVAAFANADGGVVIIGARTKVSKTHYGEEVVELRPFDQTLVDPGQYNNVASDWVYPRVEGLEIVWHPAVNASDRGIVAVRVPPQRAELKPFLVAKTIDGTKIVESFFGYAERRRDSNEPMGVADLQRALRAGLNYERTLEARLSSIEATLQNLARVSPVHDPATSQQLEVRIDEALATSDFEGDRSLVLAAYPVESVELSSIFVSAADSVRSKLERPPALRSGGWDLSTQRPAEIIRGQMLRIRGFRKILDLYRDGTFIFGCAASDGFLAWGSPEQQLHPIGVVEVMYSFCAFYDLVLRDFEFPPKAIRVRVHMRNLHKENIKTKLGAGAYNSRWQAFSENIREAPDDSFTVEKSFEASAYDPAAVAFDLLREVYLWFGLEERKVPYATSREALRVVDTDALRRA